MIPKIIHYCWFGRNPLPKMAVKCIASWRKYLPDYEIKEWNEDIFDVNITSYTQEAYSAGKYAFVSDYARFWILYQYGGIYFDTDVEVIKPFDPIISKGAFMGREAGTSGKVAPGLGLAVEPGHPLYKTFLDVYDKIHFVNKDGQLNLRTIVDIATDVLMMKGLILNDIVQEVSNVTIYPSCYFCPMDSTTGIVDITDDTFSIHWYNCSWIDHRTMRFRIHLLKNSLNRIVHSFKKSFRRK